jgi:hypothetical protein
MQLFPSLTLKLNLLMVVLLCTSRYTHFLVMLVNKSRQTCMQIEQFIEYKKGKRRMESTSSPHGECNRNVSRGLVECYCCWLLPAPLHQTLNLLVCSVIICKCLFILCTCVFSASKTYTSPTYHVKDVSKLSVCIIKVRKSWLLFFKFCIVQFHMLY